MKETNEAKKLLEEYGKHQTEILYQALMEVIVKANYEVFKEDGEMCDALMEIAIEKIQEGGKMPDALMEIAIEKMKDQFDEKKVEGATEVLLGLVQEGVLTIQDVAKRLNISEEKVKEML